MEYELTDTTYSPDTLAEKPFVRVEIPVALAGSCRRNDNSLDKLSEFIISRVPDSKIKEALAKPRNFAFRGFQRSTDLEHKPSRWDPTYDETLNVLDEYGVDKPTYEPNPYLPIWVSENLPGYAIRHACFDTKKVGFLLIYKDSDSITQDPYNYKEFGIFFDNKKMKGDHELSTYKGRLLGIIEFRFI